MSHFQSRNNIMDRPLTSSVSYSPPEYHTESRFRSRHRSTRRKHSSARLSIDFLLHLLSLPSFLPAKIHHYTVAAKINSRLQRWCAAADKSRYFLRRVIWQGRLCIVSCVGVTLAIRQKDTFQPSHV